MTAEFVLQMVLGAGVGVGVYAAIRADLARIGTLAGIAHEAAKSAHQRIDNLKGASNHG